ncbi:hypothetical protein DFH09DRAFT_1335918 [Mycena vulgaris]|nr:hypothetical protein DFH09DRAFT_1335918 [Mycena vulgaris]
MPDIGPALPPHLLARPDASEADDERQLPPPAAARRQRLQLRGRLRAGRPPPGLRPLLFLSALDPSTYSMHLGTQLDVDGRPNEAQGADARAQHGQRSVKRNARRAAAAPRERRLRKEALRGVEEHARVNMHDGPLPLPPLLRFHLTSPCLLRLSPFLPPRSHFPPTPLLSRSLPPRMGGARTSRASAAHGAPACAVDVSQGLMLRAISGLGARALAVWGCGARSPVSTRTRGVPSGDDGLPARGGCSADADTERGEAAMCAAPPPVLARAVGVQRGGAMCAAPSLSYPPCFPSFFLSYPWRLPLLLLFSSSCAFPPSCARPFSPRPTPVLSLGPRASAPRRSIPRCSYSRALVRS